MLLFCSFIDYRLICCSKELKAGLQVNFSSGYGGSMGKPKILFVFNPRSGKAKIKNKLCDIIDIFVKAGYEVTVYPTQEEGDAIRAVRDKREDYDLLVCSGGDGTLDEVVNGMIKCGKQIPIGYIPAGSTNDFARSLGIPKDMKKAAEMIVNGKDYACDIGAMNEECFVYIAAFGIFTDVSYETSQNIKNVLGHMAYILEGMKRISSIKSYRMRVRYWQKGDGGAEEAECLGDEADAEAVKNEKSAETEKNPETEMGNQPETADETVNVWNEGTVRGYQEKEIEDEFIFGMVTNSISVGGFRRITGKYVELDDGEFEVTLIRRPANPLDVNAIMASLLSRRINTDHMYCFKTAKISFESQEEIPWTTDGEFGGNHKAVDIYNWKQAVRIRVGGNKAAD